MQPVLAPDTVHVWRVGLLGSAQLVRACWAMLSADERARARRFVFARDRRRFVVAHGALRQVLARYLGRAPRAIDFAVSARGKPSLSVPGGAVLEFNLAHAGELALIGLAAGRAVGIDVEPVRALPDGLAVAEHAFSVAERTSLMAAPTAAATWAAFFCYWTRKEAILKATGDGLGVPLRRVDVAWSAQTPARVRSIEVLDLGGMQHRLGVLDLRPAPGYAAAVAAGGVDWHSTLFSWPGALA
jgi:4'-phosphopantetheinyl transferase